MLKKVFVMSLAILLIAGTAIDCVPALAQDSDNPAVVMDGESIGDTGIVSEDALLLPLRSLSEKTGFDLAWMGKEKQISMTREGKNILLKIGDVEVTVDDHTYQVSEAPVLNGGKTYVPVDFASENMGLQVKWKKSAGTVEIKKVSENPITIKTKKIVEKTKTLDMNIQYPEVQGLGNQEIQNNINSAFEKMALNAKEQGHENEEALKGDKDLLQMRPDLFYEEYLNYAVKYNSDNKLSVTFRDYSYTGGAHGMTVQTACTFDLATGKQYELKDFFKENADYVSAINKEIKSQISERDWDTLLLEPFETIKPDQGFYLANGSLVIYFPLYELVPYAAGIPEFPIEFSSLQDLMAQQ